MKSIFKTILVSVLGLIVFSGCEDYWENIEHETGHHDSKPIMIVSKGNPNVANAVEDPETQICNLVITGNNRLSYSWKKNDLSKWGLKPHEAQALAIAGYLDGDYFVCRKFDWISSDRLFRGLVNINEGYNGWEPEKFYSAKKRCFFIMSKDGRKRTNVITD
jgi:hypothetical protein